MRTTRGDMYPGCPKWQNCRRGCDAGSQVRSIVTAERRPGRPLLAVKQAIPPVRAGAVPRERLAEQLRAARTRLTMVVAPAGWGKTSLLSSLWRERQVDSWPSWLVLMVAGTLAVCLVEAGRGDECDQVIRAAAPLAATVEREGRQASTPGLAALRLAEGRRRYETADAEAAAAMLRSAVALTELHPRPSVLSRGLMYLADAELACGERRAARAALSRAREIVEDEPVSAFAVELLEEAEARIGRVAARAVARSDPLMGELTDRELSILRALQGSASQREIGSALFLSINTIKAYNKSLYRKLRVASRQDAVAAARDLGLI
jgi:LuxR family maltose regulon positive regulatory protein